MKAKVDFAACTSISMIPLVAASLGLYRFLSLQTSGVDVTPLAGACRIAFGHSLDLTGHLGIVAFSAFVLFLLIRLLTAVWRGWRDTRHINSLKPATTAYRSKELSDFAQGLYPRVQIRVVEADEPLALTIGYWSPKIIVSSGLLVALDEQELRSVLYHEAAHVARRDPLRTLVVDTCKTALPFIPAVSYLADRFRTRKELEADATAIESVGSPVPLASALAKILSSFPARTSLGVGLSPTEARIDALLGRPATDSKAELVSVVAASIPTLAALSAGLYVIAASPLITSLHICPT